MINFLKTCLFTFTIWMLASLLNGLLYGIIFSLGNIVNSDFFISVGTAFFFSLLFSVPATFLLWLVFITNNEKENLSRILLKVVFILSFLSCFIIALLPEEAHNGHWFLLAFNIIISSITSVMLHYPLLQLFHQPNHHTCIN